MKSFGIICGLLIATTIACVFAQDINVWPLPMSFSQGSTWSFDTCFTRYQKLIFFAGESEKVAAGAKASVTIVQVVAEAVTPLQNGMDESYLLTIDAQGNAVITANTEIGALRALETFSQLVIYDPIKQTYSIPNAPIMVQDSPRFTWRGLLIDSSRHYLPVSAILRQIDALAYNKMNVLHWHMVDEETFPFLSTNYPNLALNSVWFPGLVYTHQDIQNIVSYALDRGVRIVVEIDTPGHAACWKTSYPNLFVNCPANYPVIDPTLPSTYQFMNTLFTELFSLFPDPNIHLGGDEVSTDCWNSSASIHSFMQKNNIKTLPKLQAYYEDQLELLTMAQNKTPVFWDWKFSQSKHLPLSKQTILEVWYQDNSEVLFHVKQGFHVLYSTPWYLDQQNPNPGSPHYFLEDIWRSFYLQDPIGNATNYTPAQLALVLGGEACQWGEQVDATVIDERIWPRASAVGERLWSPQSVNDDNAAEPRLVSFRCRMAQRGINAGPIAPDFCFSVNTK